MRLWLPAVRLLLAALYAWHRHTTPAEKAIAPAAESRADASGASSAAPANPATAFRVAADGLADIPARFQLPGVRRARSGVNRKEWIAQYPPDQQQRILDFNQQHLGVFRVNSAEQVAWMAQNGYPLPEDVIAAEGLTDENLRELAKRGNDKAGFLCTKGMLLP